MAAILEGVLIVGIIIVAGMDIVRAARARACAWLPSGGEALVYVWMMGALGIED